MKLSLNQKSANALRDCADKMQNVTEDIIQGMESLTSVLSSVNDSAGPHSEAFEEMIIGIKRFQGSASDDIIYLAEGLYQTADKIEAYVARSAFVAGAAIGFGAKALINLLRNESVEYLAVKKCDSLRSSDDIISELSGGDITEGSCSSLAFAYIGNRAGYYVLDFRGGKSREFFSNRSSIEKIAKLPGVISITLTGKKDIECVHSLLSKVESGKEYYLATGQHAAIVRKTDEGFEYLELQHPSNGNGWHKLDDTELTYRFGCSQTRLVNSTNFLMEAESLGNSPEFTNMLGFINTSALQQRKGVHGNVR